MSYNRPQRLNIEETASTAPAAPPKHCLRVRIVNCLCGCVRLLRVQHWVKNALVFVPLFFSLNALPPDAAPFAAAAFGFAAFSLASSAVYILNDLRDRERDRLHSVKRLRPIASGAVSVRAALALLAAVLAALALLLVFARADGRVFGIGAILILAFYLVSNAAYSFGLKNVPLVDVTLLASGYVLRVLFGAALIGVEISVWLYLVVSAGAFYLGLGKRRNEIAREGGETRNVLKFYTHNFLDKNMYVCQTLCVVFYSLWSIDRGTIERIGTGAFVYTVPVVFMILLKYSLNIERDSDGDPTSVILRDKVLLALCAAYCMCAAGIMYFCGGSV